MNPDLMKHRDQATKIQQRYHERLSALKGDEDLTSEARQRRMAQEYATAKRELEALSVAEKEALSSRYSVLESQLYKAPYSSVQDPASHAISMRDASSRAAQLTTPEQAAQEMAVAESNGDAVMARAILRAAVHQPRSASPAVSEAWAAVVEDYVERHTEVQRMVGELADIEDMSERQLFSPFAAMTPADVAPQYLNEAASAELSGVEV